MREKLTPVNGYCRYVVLNPVRAGMTEKPDEWRWSSYHATAYGGKVPEFLTIDWVLGQFAKTKVAARQQYRRFVAEGVATPTRPWGNLVGQLFLGSENFVARMREKFGDRQEIKEIPRVQRYPGRPPLDQLLAGIRRNNQLQRNRSIIEAHISHGYTLKEIADVLGLHYTTVSKVVSRKKKK